MDLFTGLHGWGEGFVAEGFKVIGVDLVDMRKELDQEPLDGLTLLLQDILTLHGAQFKDAAVIVASPPCQKYSYMAMPWAKAKVLAAWYRESPERIVELNALFNACFRIQREASEAAGHYIPLIVENVKGAQPWVGRAQAHFGSFYLWGDVGQVGNRVVAMNGQLRDAGVRPRSAHKVAGFRFDGSGGSFQTAAVEATGQKENPDGTGHPTGSWFAIADSKNRGASKLPSRSLDAEDGKWRPANGLGLEASDQIKVPGQDWSRFAKTGEVSPHWRLEGLKTQDHLNIRNGECHTRHLTNPAEHTKNNGGSWFNVAHNTESGVGQNPDGRGVKGFTPNGEPLGKNTLGRMHSSKSPKRKAASALIAKIPFPLARYIASQFKDQPVLRCAP